MKPHPINAWKSLWTEMRCNLVVDDGVATGSTLIAALKFVKAQSPRELIAAVPVAAPR